MAHYFWIGQTPSTNAGLNPFSWNVANNWRTLFNSTSIPTNLIDPIRVGTTPPNNPPNGKDTVWIGHPVYTQATDGTRTYIQAKSPVLFGGLTGGITLNSSHGITWALSTTSLGNTFSLEQIVIGGVPWSNTDDPADPVTFTGAYPFEMIGGGISGGESYWPTITDFVTWAKARFSGLGSDWPTSTQISGMRNKDALKVKTNRVQEVLHTPLNVYLKIAKSPEINSGSTLPKCNYFRYGTKVRTSLYDSTLSSIENTASINAAKEGGSNSLILVDPDNNLFLKRSAFDNYVGRYDDSVQVSHDCVWNKIQISANTPPEPQQYVKNRWFVTIGGKAGITYTAPYLGLKQSTMDIDEDLQLLDGKRKQEADADSPPVLYDDDHKVKIGHQSGLAGVTTYMRQIEATNNNIAFDGNVIIEKFNQYNCYVVSDHQVQTTSDNDTTNIFYYRMQNDCKLDLSHTPDYNGWKFGNIFIDQSTGQLGITVEGGIKSIDGSNNQIFGSPGVNLFNDILSGFGNTTKRLPTSGIKRTIEEVADLGL